jgi:serine/threonine-protein kinase
MVISGYDIKSEIHRGPVTTVYEAYHLALERRVLLKVLNTQWIKEKDLIARFRREAKICARLDHPNIVKIFDFNSTDDSVFISMEYVEGSTLDLFIQQNETISFPEIINTTIQILTGLSFAHKQDIIHRDIKPSNIMLSSEGSVKITDFGLAVVSDLPGITGQDQTVGSPAYMSPEQTMGKELDHRSDLFSLGVSLYKVCSKKSPFETDTIGSTIQNILIKKVDKLSEINPDIPVWFSDLVDSLLAKDRVDRPESADSVLNVIRTKISSREIKEQNDVLNSTGHKKILISESPLTKRSTSKYQTKIFLWILPIITVLSYLIFSQSDDGSAEPTTNMNNTAIKPVIITPDTIVQNNIDKTFGEKNIIDEGHRKFGNASQVTHNEIKNDFNSFTDRSFPKAHIEKSKLYITAKPWADIYIDSVYYEQTPILKSIALDPGLHFIELKNPNFQTFSQYYDLTPAQSETLIIEMKMNVGFLNIRVLPWANIYIDGEYKETSPIDQPITLATGEHIVTLTNPNFVSIKDTIEVRSGKTINKKFNFIK